MANQPPMSVTEATTKRISYRRFLNKPVSEQDVRSILDKARFAPSGGNTQPWHCYVLAGEAKAKLTKAILENAAKPSKAEYRMYPGKEDMPKDMFDLYMKRRRTLASEMYRLMGISYNDKKGRAEAMMKNFDFFGAPVGIIVTVDRPVDMNGWGHVGSFLQTICLLAEERGMGTCLQEAFGNYPTIVYDELNIPKDQILWCGIALGYPDMSEPVNSMRSERAPVDDFAVFHGFTSKI